MLMLLRCSFAVSQERSDSFPVMVMFYNVENLFDTFDDPLTEDDEFLPDGLMRWNQSRYNKKINSVYKVIIAAGGWNPPAIIGLCEIENRKVLEDLVYGTLLSKYSYGIVHKDSPDTRGIDVCMIFRKDLVQVIEYRSWIPGSTDKADFHSRSILYAKCAIRDDTVHLIINHWPSRRGGVLAGEPLRKEISDMIRNAVDSIGRSSTGPSKIIILGDFNCSPDDPVIQGLVNPDLSNGPDLVNLAAGIKTYNSGTYRYQGAWEILDQIIVSAELLNCKKGLFAERKNFRIFMPDFLLKNESKYPGITPFSTYKGYRYQGGFSDHLPVLLDLGIR